MTHDEAVGALLELTAAEWDDLLEGWDSGAHTAETAPRGHTVSCTIVGKSTGLGFIAFAKSPFEALIAAMALAVVAGEMALPRVKRIDGCSARTEDRVCNRPAHNDGRHQDGGGGWYFGADGSAVPHGNAVPEETAEEAAPPRVSKCEVRRRDKEGVKRGCFRTTGHYGEHEDTLGCWKDKIVEGVSVAVRV